MSQNPSIALIADAHVHGGSVGKADEFFKMLDHLLKIRCDVVFLGDIFELWIALNGYEDEIHKRFVKWCAEARTKREIGFIEGNHEFFVDACRSGAFSWTSESGKLIEDGTLFAHGDLFNKGDWNYRLMRVAFKSRLAKVVLRACGSSGPALAEKIRVSLKKTDAERRKGVPTALLEPFAERCGRLGAKRAIIGHFHEKGRLTSKSGVELHIVPAWRDAGIVGVYGKAGSSFELKRWSEVW